MSGRVRTIARNVKRHNIPKEPVKQHKLKEWLKRLWYRRYRWPRDEYGWYGWMTPKIWVRHALNKHKYHKEERRKFKEHMKLPPHQFDISKKYRVTLFWGAVSGWAIDCLKCGCTVWTTGNLDTIDDIGEYSQRGCLQNNAASIR